MREKIKDPGRFQHMLEMALLLEQEKDKHSLDSIKENKLAFYGLAKMVEIIGEASYKLTHEFKETHPQLPWNAMEGMRHIMVHGYYSISPERLWTTIVNDIPVIIPILQSYLEED